MIRLFAAIAIPGEIGETLARRQQGLPGARWRPASALHLTLRFIGEVAETTAEDVDAELALVAGPALSLELESVGVFQEGDEIRALWAGASENEPLRRLAARCEAAARRAGLAPERRVWRPHVTLAYLRRADPARVATWVQANSLLKSPLFQVKSFGLYSSHLGQSGASYQLERLYRLG
ncbi:MAG TPA: RNA 2',3'-cyclic phosphodiesterase [Caulobacteraceae bacterium]|nr:RNA 2',3'-cyclic phosphodiesterase [Caulobacteraceae bacterium]